jgi:hypothetical protein
MVQRPATSWLVGEALGDRAARWTIKGEERDELASARVTMRVYWRKPSHRSVEQRVFLVHRDRSAGWKPGPTPGSTVSRCTPGSSTPDLRTPCATW